jgi:hypothetical protein
MSESCKSRTKQVGRILAALVVLLLANAAVRGQAFLTQTLDTTALNTATYDDLTGNAGPFPFSNLGVSASTNLGLLVSASVNGSTTFQFPTFTPGQVIATGSTLNYAYTPTWSGGSVGSHAGLSASATLSYDLGPFSGSNTIFDTALNTSANGVIGGGTTLTGGTANGTTASAPVFAGITESAFLASASVGVNVGLNLQTALNFNPAVQYGYYSWINTTGSFSPTDSVTFTGVGSGALDYTFGDNLDAAVPGNTFFLNFAPAVQVDLPITPTSTVGLPLSGDFHADALGTTLVDETLPLGTVSLYNANYDTWDDDMNFNGKYYSLELTQSDQCPGQDISTPNCAHYTVDGSGVLLGSLVQFPGGGSSGNLTGGGGTGSFDGNYASAPLVPGVCDPTTGICYQSNDANLPVGPGSVTFTGTPVGTPEPGMLLLLALGGLGLFFAVAGRRSVGLATA